MNDGTFLFSYSFQIINLPQFLIESTISECGETGKGLSTNHLYYGNQSLSSTNISKNLGYADAACDIVSPDSLHFIFWTSEGNEVSNKDCHWIGGSIPYSFDQCNFIQNKCGNSIFWSDINVIFSKCNLVGNTKGKEFAQNTATLYRSYYDGDTTIVAINSPIENIPNEIHHLSFGCCFAKNPFNNAINQRCVWRSFNCQFDASITQILSINLTILSMK